MAIPFPRNFNPEDKEFVTTLYGTSFFGGNKYTWTKKKQKSSHFVAPAPGFSTRKYVKDTQGKISNKRDAGIADNVNYYLDSFTNNGNIPAFDAELIDTLPSYFDTKKISISMDKKDGKTPKLTDWFASNHPVEIEFKLKENAKNPEEPKEPVYVSIGNMAIDTENTTGDELVWKADIKKAIEDYQKEHPDVELTGNIKIKLKHRIEKNEKFEGTVTINGDLPKGKNYENKLNANYDEWLYVQDTADTEEFYQKIHRKATEEEATINAQPGVPEINVDTYTDDGSGAVYNDPTVTPVFTKYAGYRYRLANNSNYRIVPGILETGNLLIKNDKELQGGLLAKNIFVSKELLNVAPVESIKLVYHDGRSDNFDSKHLSYDANGNIDLKVPTSKILKNAVIRFKHFNAKTNFSDDKYVLVNGMPNVIGTIPVKGKFRTDYGNPNYDRSAEDVGTLDVATLNMNLYANSFKINDDNTENKSGINTSSSSTVNSITVKNHCPNTGYDFEIENNSKASSGSSKMFIDLSQNVGDKAKSINPVIKGFMTKNIKISNIAATADIESISVYDWDQNSEDSPALKLSKDQLNISDDAIEIKKAILEKHNIKAVKYIEIKFSDYKNQDINNVQRLKIRLTGKSDWYDNLDAKATFSCDNVFLKPQTRKVTARIHIDRPKLSVRTNLYYYDNVKETAASQSGNDDGNRTRLAVPYDRDFRMEATVDNKSISTLDNPDISVYIPVNNGLHLQEAHTGFHTTKVVLTKELLESYGDIEDLSLYDVDKQLFPAKLTYDKSTNAFKTREHTFTPNSNGDIVLTEKDLNDLGVKYLTKIFITGHDFALQGNGKIKVYGFSDAPFGNKSIFKADTANYLDSIREERYKVYAMDDSLLMISKMYFDATIVAGYKDSAGGDRFDKTSTSIEHVRRRHYRCSASFGDNSELDIGYKSLGSYMIDFRQYLNAGYNYPVDPTRNNYISQEQQDKNYVYTQSYNTAAYVRMKVTIPHDKFETYYLKVDPRAKDYYQKIEVVYKDGTIHEILPEDWQNNGLETATTGEKFFRINLMKGTPNYSGDETEYYRAQKDYPNPENPVEHIILHLRINQEESTVEDGKEIAKNPDYGTWFNARDQKTKYMFEITGRFYDEGKAEASVKSDITIGGDKLGNSRNRTGIKAKKRTDDSDVSSWSYWNKYRFYWKSGGYCYQDDDFYDSRHLVSSARVWVSHDMNNVLKGVLSNPDKDEDLNRIYGDEYDYDVSFYRTPKGKNSDYLAGKNTDEWWDEDSFDWSSKISYGDQVELNDTLPLVHRDTTDEASEYKGFLTKNIRLSDKLYKYTKEVEIKTRHVTETGAVSAGRVIKLKPSDITDSNGGFHPINVRYKDLGESKSESNEIEMEHDEYVMSYKVILRDIPGGVNFAREYNKTSEMDFHDTRSTSDVKIGGNVYSIREIDDKVKYATNKMESRSYADKGDSANPKEITANLNSDKAAMMAFRIPFQAGVRIDSLDNNIVMDFHDKTQSNPNRDPNYASFGVKVWNRSDGSAADGSQNSAHIMNAKVTNNMHDKFRLKHIYIPGAFIDGDWFEVKNLVLKYNGKTYNYDKKELKKSPLLSKDSEGNYVFDVNGFIREHVNEFSTYKVNNTDESYVKEQITDFDIELSAVNPSRSDPKTVLDGGQYITFDKNNGYSFKYDGVYADRTKEEVEADEWTLNSVPTVFYPPNKYKYKHDKENNGLRQYVDATFATSDQNAQPYGGYAAGTNRYDSCLVGNTVADMVVNLTKTSETGGTTTRAYDNSNRDGESPRLAVDQNHLAPEDYIEYTLYMGADASSSIDLAKMFSDITVPEGMRIVGYRLGENTTSIPDEDISVKVGEGSTAKELKSNKIYSLAEDGSKTDYSRVSVECGKLPKDSFVKPGKYVKLILVAQLTNNAEFEGKDIKPFVWEAAAAHTHTYSQYRIYRQGGAGRNNSHNWGSDVWYTSDGDIAYYHGYKKYLNKFLNVPNEKTYISKVVTQDKFVNPGIAVSYTFDDAIRHYDKQPMTIKVSGPKAGAITNDTRHHLKDATFEVSFLSALNDKLYKNFDMTKKFEVNYPKNMDSSGHKDIKIEYCFTEDSKKDPSIGIYDKGTATEKWVDQKFVVTSKSELSTGKYLIADASKVRWTYYEIPDMGNDGNEVVFAPQGEPFEFKGLGRYRDIRTDAEKQGRLKTYADRYDMKIYASKDFYHSHEEDIDNSIAGKKGTTTKKYSSDVHLHAKASTNKLIARERPVPTLHTQIFETKDEAEAEYSSTKSQKLGYRPNETVWFKTTLKNKILTPETADSQMQGVLREPVIYDKIPEYITTEGLSSKDITIKWYDEKGNEKPVPSYSIKSSKDLSAPDYGGAMTVTEKANDGESLGEGHAYQDFKLGGLGSNTKSKDTKYNLYKIEFEKGTRLEIGERIELSYSAKIREKDLPTVLTRKADGSFYMDYYPKTSEYYQYDSRWINSYQRYAYGYPHFSSAKERILSHGPYSETFRRRLDNENRLMDMHFLQHDVGVSGSINPNIDMFEYLKDAISYMPGSPDESSDRGGSNGWLKDLDMSPTHSYQQDPEYNPVFEAGKTVMDKKPSADKVQYLKAGHNRDYYQLLMRLRNKLRDWDDEKEEGIVWAQARTHLKMSWLASSSQIIPKEGDIQKDKEYLAQGMFDGKYNKEFATHKNHTPWKNDSLKYDRFKYYYDDTLPKIEYNQKFTTRIGAYNYGDWDVSGGVKFTYVMPRGIEPVVEDGKVSGVTAKVLSGGNSLSPTYAPIDADAIEVKILQRPGDERGYKSPMRIQDPLLVQPHLNRTTDDYSKKPEYYDNDDKKNSSWVLEIKVKRPVKKWVDRGSGKEYQILADIPSRVYRTNADEYWYDEVYARPIEPESQENLYYQIYDEKVTEKGHTKVITKNTRMSTQVGGMDYLYSCTDYGLGYINGAPSMPYIDGYNISNREETLKDGEGTVDQGTEDNIRSGHRDTYAVTGTRARMRKPFVRTWATVGKGSNVNSGDPYDYYVNGEFDSSSLNVHLENNYYWYESSPASTGYSYNNIDRFYHSYSTDGGNKGTLFYPVVNDLLPPGVVPKADDGTLFTKDNNKNDKKTLAWRLRDKEGNILDSEKPLYKAKVIYVPTVTSSGEKEGRYRVVFLPSDNTNPETRINNLETKVFQFDFYTKNYPDDSTKDGKTNEDLMKQYQSNRIYVGSQLDNFKLVTDKDISGNPYYVGAKCRRIQTGTYDYLYSDYRKDAVKVNFPKNNVKGVLPDHNINLPILGTSYGIINDSNRGGNLRYKETDEFELEDYTNVRNSVKIKDVDWNLLSGNDDKDYVSEGTSSDNRIRVKKASVKNETYVSHIKPDINGSEVQNLGKRGQYDKEIYYPDKDSLMEYGDKLYYTVKMSGNAGDKEYEYMGDINHAKLNISFHLPKIASYRQKYYKDDLYIISRNSAGDLTMLQGLDEIEAAGYKVEKVKEKIKDDGKEVVTFEIVTPGEGTSYQDAIDGKRIPGYFGHDETLYFGLRTDIDNGEDPDTILTGDNFWDDKYSAETYASYHDAKGNFLNKRFHEGGFDDLDANGMRYTRYKKHVKDKKPSGEENFADDFDLDGEYDESFATDISATVKLRKPHSKVRVDTDIRRILLTNPDADVQVAEDPTIKGARHVKLHLDQAQNDGARVGEFAIDYRIPFRGTDYSTAEEAQPEDGNIDTYVYNIRTGVWEIPESAGDTAYREALANNLKVHVYALCAPEGKTPSEAGATYQNISTDWRSDSSWKRITPKEGVGLRDNKVINTEEYGNRIYQIRYVITASEDDVEKARTYGVPKGFRLDVDANDKTPEKEEMNDIDPSHLNVNAMPKNVEDNSAYVEIVTINNHPYRKHVNSFVNGMARYCDKKSGATGSRSRAGHYISYEIPVIFVDMSSKYFKLKKEGGKKKFKWDSEMVVDPSLSTMIKYRAEFHNLSDAEIKANNIDQDEDNCSMPQVSIAMPYLDKLDRSKSKDSDNKYGYRNFKYLDYASEYSGSKLDDTYSGDKPIYNNEVYWTWHVEDKEGNFVDTTGRFKDKDVRMYDKYIDLTNLQRTIVTWDFDGYLKPGEHIIVECMVPIESKDHGMVNPELLNSKLYGFKDGSFRIHIPEESTITEKWALEYDTRDINVNDKTTSEATLTKQLGGLSFASQRSLVRNKTSHSEYGSGLNEIGNGASVPSLVPEGSDYSFSADSINTDVADSLNPYERPIIYDELPYEGDHNTNGEPRNSKWSGIIKPDSVKVYSYYTEETGGISKLKHKELVDGKDVTIWVGPIKKEGGKLKLLSRDVLPKPEETTNQTNNGNIWFENLYGTSAQAMAKKESFMIKLSDLKAAKGSLTHDEYRDLLENVYLIYAEPNSNYELGGRGKLQLKYELHAPLNLPMYSGCIKEGMSDDAICNEVKDVVGWNTYTVRDKGGIPQLSSRAGVYLDAPPDRGYIGHYVWFDESFNTKFTDEGDYYQRESDGRWLLRKATKDLDYDGKPDDPGINGVKVELISESGYPVNKDGEPVTAEISGGEATGKYVIIDESTGEYKKDTNGTNIYTRNGPKTYETERDAYGHNGYFILSNVKPGKYKLRYNFPAEYSEYALSTLRIGNAERGGTVTDMEVYRKGDKLPDGKTAESLVVMTKDAIQIDAVGTDPSKYREYDERMTAYDIGVGNAYLVGGYAWHDNEGGNADGWYKKGSENPIKNVNLKFYEVDEDGNKISAALDRDGKEAGAKTDEKGYFSVTLRPYRSYMAVGDMNDVAGVYKVSPVNISRNPLKNKLDNDAYADKTKKPASYVFALKPKLNNGGKPVYISNDSKTYDYKEELGFGFVEAGAGYIGKTIFCDKNYNGINGNYKTNDGTILSEPGVENVRLVADQYYYDSDAKEWKLAKKDYKEEVSNGAGNYVLQKVPTSYVKDDKTYLAGYKVRVDMSTIPEGYVPTKYLMNNGERDSDLPLREKETIDGKEYRYLNRGYILLAEETEDQSTGRIVEYDGKHYNLEEGISSLDNDGGITEVEEGRIVGIVWEDKNHDGQRTEEEKRMSGMKVSLEPYYYDNAAGKWKKYEGAKAEYRPEVTTDADGKYEFDNLPTYRTEKGKRELVSYKIRVKDDIESQGYAATLYRRGDTKSDSDLIAENGYLTKSDEHIILARKVSESGDEATLKKEYGNLDDAREYTISNKLGSYDINKAEEVSGYDAGLIKFEKGKISGKVWDDADYDGLLDADEEGIKGVKVTAESYYHDGTKWKKTNAAPKTEVTDADGRYSFNDLETYVLIDGQYYLLGYKVEIDNKSGNNPDINTYAITKYHVEDESLRNSDLRKNGKLNADEEYVIVSDKAKTEDYYAKTVDGEKYDIIHKTDVDGIDAGYIKYGKSAIEGNVFEDKEYDGLKDGEDGFSAELADAIQNSGGKLVITLKYYYYEGGKWHKLMSGGTQKSSNEQILPTGDGTYRFGNLPTMHVVDNKPRLAGYKLEFDMIPDEYNLTKLLKGKGKGDSSAQHDEALRISKTLNDKYVGASLAEEKDGYLITSEKKGEKSFNIESGYDLVIGRTLKDYNIGYAPKTYSKLRGLIFDDVNYDGKMEEAVDKGYNGQKVYLTQYYHDSGSGKWIETEANTKTFTVDGKTYKYWKETLSKKAGSKDGIYEFDNLPAYIEKAGKRYLASYSVRSEKPPKGYGATYLHMEGVDDEHDSDYDIKKDGLLRGRSNDKIIVASETEGGDNYAYEIKLNSKIYDVADAKPTTRGHDGGITKCQNGSISGVAWDDADYNGIFDSGEKGLKDITMCLDRYYYDSGTNKWIKDQDEEHYAEVKTDANGNYIFENLPTHIEKSGKRYLYGYIEHMLHSPYSKAVTKYQTNNGDKDSALLAKTLEIKKADKTIAERKGDYIVVAHNANDDVTKNESYIYEGYDVLKAEKRANYNAGFKDSEQGSIEGIVFDDLNEDGISNDEGIEGVELTLKHYTMKRGGDWEYEGEETDTTILSGSDGTYSWENLPLFKISDGETVLCGYKVKIEELPDGYTPIIYHANDGENDSDLDENIGTLVDETKIFPLAGKAESGVDDMYIINGYDYLISNNMTDLNAGLHSYSNGKLAGILFEDANGNGIKESNEKVISGKKIILEYLKDGKYAAYKGMTSVTNKKGRYEFKNLPMVDENYEPIYYRVRMFMDSDMDFTKKYRIPERFEENQQHMNYLGKDWSLLYVDAKTGITEGLHLAMMNKYTNYYGQQFGWKADDKEYVDIGVKIKLPIDTSDKTKIVLLILVFIASITAVILIKKRENITR